MASSGQALGMAPARRPGNHLCRSLVAACSSAAVPSRCSQAPITTRPAHLVSFGQQAAYPLRRRIGELQHSLAGARRRRRPPRHGCQGAQGAVHHARGGLGWAGTGGGGLRRPGEPVGARREGGRPVPLLWELPPLLSVVDDCPALLAGSRTLQRPADREGYNRAVGCGGLGVTTAVIGCQQRAVPRASW